MAERRMKVGYVGTEFLVELFCQEALLPRFWSPEIPADAEVRGVEVDLASDCFRVLFFHPSFLPVSEGSAPPRVQMVRRPTPPTADLLVSVLDTLTPPQRQALYERLYTLYGCRVYRP